MNKLSFLMAAIALVGISCSKQPQTSGTDDAKLRPEVAAAEKGASPSPSLQGTPAREN